MSDIDIRVRVETLDHLRKTRRFKTLEGARRFAQRWVGEAPDLGSWYAVSFDGIAKVTVSGATLADIFPKSAG
jgi:hypothetical protein